MASAKPKQPPTGYSATVADTAIHDLYFKVFGKEPPAGYAIADWKRYVESTGRWDGADAGGIRDVLNADALMLDSVKTHLDNVDGREQMHYSDLSDQIASLEAKLTQTPFPT